MTQQKGSSHVIIIIGLVVALIGALGFVFWQNFIYKEPVATDNDKVAVKEEKVAGDDTDISGLLIDEWKIEIPVDSSYTVSKFHRSDEENGKNQYTVYAVSNNAIGKEARSLECPDDKLGDIIRTTDFQQGDPRIRTEKIAGYYYLYAPRSELACAGVDGAGPEKLNVLMDESNKIFISSFPKTVTSN